MKLVQMKVTNFRCYREETVMDLDDLVVIVGKNDVGKSSLFDALNIFFDERGLPEKDDLSVQADGQEIRIACSFSDLPSAVVIDAQHPTDLEREYLLNARGHLEIVKVYDCSGAKPKAVGVYARALHPTAENYQDLLQLNNSKLKQRASSLGVDLSHVNQTVNTELRRAIWQHVPDLQCQEREVELAAEAAKAIWDQLKKHLPVFALFKADRPSTDQDAEAQDPMRAAIKEAIKAQEAVLSQIAETVKGQVQEIADRTVQKIAEMNPQLARQLTPRVSTKNWDTLFSVSLTGDEDIPINKRGSGTRRLVLLNFFRAKAEKDAEEKSTGVIYAIEEPETSQHPHNQIMLVKALEELAENPGCQVFLTTHTPMLARRFRQGSLRLIAEEGGRLVVHHGDDEGTLHRIVNSLGVLPDHNIKVFVGVEGGNDIAFLRAISKILHDAGEEIPDLGAAEDGGQLVFVPLGGSNLDLWVSRLQGFHRPEFYLFDRDHAPPDPPRYERIADQINRREGCRAWHTKKRQLENYLHSSVIKRICPKYTGVDDDFEDVPMLLARAVHEQSGGGEPWEEVIKDKDKFRKKISGAKKRLCSEAVGWMTPELLTLRDPEGEVRGWLREIGAALQT